MAVTTAVASDPSADSYLSPLEVWRWIAVAAIVATNLLIAVFVDSDPCAGITSLGLFFGWVVAPAVGIAGLGVVAWKGDRGMDRIIATVLVIALTAAWTYALVWSSVGTGIDSLGC
jgi:hypothetical protein